MISSKLYCKPKQYIQGFVEFYKLKFKVTPDALIPRPETELLVDEVLKSIKYYVLRIKDKVTVVDVGTGAGNIAISIAKNLNFHPRGVSSNISIIATDISSKALKLAKQNAKLHGVDNKILFIRSDLLTSKSQKSVRSDTEMFYPDIIVSNLPYIPSSRIPYLDSSVKDYEPHIALDGGSDGFELYRKLFAQIKEKKLKPSLVVGEIDYTHGEIAIDEAYRYFPESKVEIKSDLAHRQRILIVRF